MTHEAKQRMLTVLHILGVLAAAAALEALFLLTIVYFRTKWEGWVWALAVSAGTTANAAVLAAELIGYFFKKEAVYKLCITLFIMGIVLAAGAYALVRTGFFEIMRDEESLEAYLERSGGWMGVIFTLLQFLQVVILPIPSTVTVVAGTALFGPLKGSLLSLLGIVIGSLVAFLIGRYAGLKVVAWMIGKETLEKWLKKIKGKDKLLLTAMFLLPVFPDDVLCFVAGISSMSIWYFLAVILISRILAIFTTSYSVSLIPFNTWWGILIWAVLITLVVVLFIFLYKKTDAILGWFERKFRRIQRVEEKPKRDEFKMEVVGPDGTVVSKGVKKEDEKK